MPSINGCHLVVDASYYNQIRNLFEIARFVESTTTRRIFGRKVFGISCCSPLIANLLRAPLVLSIALNPKTDSLMATRVADARRRRHIVTHTHQGPMSQLRSARDSLIAP